jgi:hypothetical protein
LTARHKPHIKPGMPQERAAPVVLAAAAFYAAFTFTGLALHGWNPLWFVWIGERWANLDPQGHRGYDGQFVYYVARDGWAALPHIDNAPYRLQRILYAMLARLLSGGDAALLPWVMVAINAAAILVTTWLITAWLAARGVWTWYGLAYPLFVGTLMSYSRDLTEPLAYALALAGVVCWLGARRSAAVVLLAAAPLARETTVLFIACLAAVELLERRWRRVAVLALTLAPMLTWQVYVRTALGTLPVSNGLRLVRWPSTFAALNFSAGRLSAFLFVGLPTLALVPLALRWVARAPRDPIAWLVAVHSVFALFVSPNSQQQVLVVGRHTTALLLCLLLALPRCERWLRVAVVACAVLPTLLWLPPVLWWAPWTARF